MGSLTNFPIDQVESIGVDIEVNNLSDEHFRDVMEELTNHQIPERDKCPLVRRLNASISGYFKSTGDVGFSKMGPVKMNTNNNNNKNSTINSKPGSSSLAGDLSGSSGNNNNNRIHSNSSNHGVDNGNSIELIEYRRTFEYKNYHSPKSCSNPSDIKIKSSERTKGSIGVNSSTTSATIHPSSSTSPSTSSSTSSSSSSANNNSTTISNSSSSNVTLNESNVDSFVNFDSLKRPPNELNEPSNEPTEGINLIESPITPSSTLNTTVNSNSNLSNNFTTNNHHTINTIINNNTITNDNLNNNNSNKDVNKDSKDNSNNNNNNNNNNQTTNDTNNNAKGNRNGKEKKKKAKDKNLYKTVYTAQDIDGHIGDKSIEDLVYYVTGNKGEIVATSNAPSSGITVNSTSPNINTAAGGGNLTCNNNNNLITGSIVTNPGPDVVSVATSITTPANGVIGVFNNNIGASVQCGSSLCDNKLATNSKNNKESGNFGGKVKKKEKPLSTSISSSVAVSATSSLSFSSSSLVVVNNSTNIQGRNKKGSNNNNNNGLSGLGKSIPRSSSATTFDSKFPPSSSSSSPNVAQSEVNSSSMDASLTSPSLSKSHSIESSSSSLTVNSMQQQQQQQPVTKLISDSGITTKSKVKDFYPTNSNVNKKILNNNNVVINSDGLRNKKRDTSASSTHVATTANQDVDANNFKELRYTASDPETVDQETSFQPVKSKHLKRRKGTSRNKPVGGGGGVVGGDLGMQSPSTQSSNTIFTTSNSSSSSSTIPSVTSSTCNSVNISMTARGYESEREYCADEYRRRKEYLNHRKLASSMPHSEQNSADNSDMESSCSYPVSGRMPILPTPPGPPASSNNSISSTPKVSYADIAKMGSVIAVTPPVVITGNSAGSVANKGPSPTNITLNSVNNNNNNNNNNNSGKDANNNISTGSIDNSPKNASTGDSGLSLQTVSSPTTSCSPYPSSSPNCISPSGFSLSSSSNITFPEGSKGSKNTNSTTTTTINNNQINKLSSSSLSSESIIDATTTSKDNPPTIKSEINFDQEISSKNGKNIGTFTNNSNQINSAAVAIRPKDFDTPKETKMENQKVICEDNFTTNNNNNDNKPKNDKKMDKSTIKLTSSSSSSSCLTSNTNQTSTCSSSNVPKSTISTILPTISTSLIVAKTVAKCSSTSAPSNSKTLEALLSPPAEKTPTFDMKNSNKLIDTRVASIKSDTSSRASMLKKSNSIPGAGVKNNSNCYRVNLNESTNRSTKSPSSLPPVIMNDDSDATDEIESSFTFGFFDDVTSSSSSSPLTTTTTTTTTKTTISLKNSSLNYNNNTIKPMSSSASTKNSTTAPISSTPTSTSGSVSLIKSSSMMMTNRSLNSSSKTITVKNNYDNLKNGNNANSSSSVSRVKSTKNASTTNLTHLSANLSSSSSSSSSTISSTPTTTATTNNLANKTGTDSPKSSEAINQLPQGKKNSDKDSKSISSNGNTSLEKFIAIKLAEPPTNMDADINTFNYNQIINFIKTAWESVMCQYHHSPDKNNSHSSSSSSSSSNTGANLFRESTIYYKELISP